MTFGNNTDIEVAVFGGGCFWCTEAVFQELRGVVSVTSGYVGGDMDNPTYEQVSSGNTGHAEVIRIEYSPDEISYTDLLNVFFAVHDPTTRNRQGNDIGTQYRSVIVYTSDTQRAEAERIVGDLKGDGVAVVTEVVPLTKFFEAESYHKNYYRRNKTAPYCELVINPKLEKFQKHFSELLKK